MNAATPGLLDFVVENDLTDWNEVAFSLPQDGTVTVPGYLKRPADAAYYALWSDGVRGGETFVPKSDEEILAELDLMESNGEIYPVSRNGHTFNGEGVQNIGPVEVATYVKQTQMVHMQARYAERMTVYRWFDADMNCLGTEKVTIQVSHRNTSAKRAVPGCIDEARLTFAGNYTADQKANITPSYQQMMLDYTLAAGCSKTYPKPETLLEPPVGATWYSLVHIAGTGMPQSSGGNVSGALALVPTALDRIEEFMITWTLEGGKTLQERLSICIKTPEATPWFEKVPDWSPVNVKHIQVTGDGGVIENRNMYQNGRVRLMPSGNVSTNVALENARVHIVINAPANAVSYKMALTQENVGQLYQEPDQRIVDFTNNDWDWYEAQPVDANGTITHTIAPFIKDESDTQVTLYQIDQLAGGRYGTADFFHVLWLDANGQPISTQYAMYQTTDPFMVARYGKHLQQENELIAPISVPCYVDDVNDWQLKCTYYAQSGEDALLVELELCDEDGWNVQPDGETVFYLPYPEGFTADTECTYLLRHYDATYETYTMVPVEATPYGLRFTTSSLSPFELSWKTPTVAPPTPTPAPMAAPSVPKTGDQTPLALMATLALLSCVGCIHLLRKRSHI